MYPHLPRIEVYFYSVMWILGVSYSVYNIFLLGHEFRLDNFGVLVQGWSFLGRRKDVSDFEWCSWLTFIPVMLPLVFVQIIVAEFIRWKNSSLLPIWYFLFSAGFMGFILGPTATVFMVLQPCIIYISALTRSRSVVWIVSLTFVFVICNLEIGLDQFNDEPEIHYLIVVSMAWNNLRSVSFCLDNLFDIHYKNLLNLLAYCFYLPTLFFGPVILYDKFEKGLSTPYKKWTGERLTLVILQLFRFFGWAVVAELSLHYLRFCTLQRLPEVVENLRPWALYGLGYCMGQFFMVKYTVMYGVSATCARIEHIDAPHHPKCIARIHLYSNMWRHFDQGLYLFLAKYIYIPCCGKDPHLLKKCFASFVCFSFVYLWHGLYRHVLIWSFLNFLGVTIEASCKAIGSSLVYKEWESKLLSKRNTRRLKALVSIPLFIMAAISNFYFFAGELVGNIFILRLFSGSLLANSTLFLFCYFCCQVSIEVSNWEESRMKKISKNE